MNLKKIVKGAFFFKCDFGPVKTDEKKEFVLVGANVKILNKTIFSVAIGKRIEK